MPKPLSDRAYFTSVEHRTLYEHIVNIKTTSIVKLLGNLYEGHCESVDLCAAYYENGFYF